MYRNKLHMFFMSILFLSVSPEISAKTTNVSIERTFKPYSEILEEYLEVKNLSKGGLVTAFNYSKALGNSQTKKFINSQTEILSNFNIEVLDSKEKAISFWINSYNFFMLKYILENPKKSNELVSGVKDFGSFFNPYSVFKKQIFEIGSKSYSLDDIEKGTLLSEEYKKKGWKDARIHFAVNCASVGCPPLRKKVYTENKIDEMLTENTQRALLTPRHFRLDNNTIYLTELFKWYESDFVEEEGSVINFLRKYLPNNISNRLTNDMPVKYIDYDWNLNKPDNFKEIKN